MSSCLITACGPTLEPEKVEALRGKLPLIAVSDTAALFPWCDHMVSIDTKWWTNHGHKVADLTCPKWGYAACEEAVPGVKRIQIKCIEHAPTSGHAAVCLAIRLGYKVIYLAGYTFGETDRAHYFERPVAFRNFRRWHQRMKEIETLHRNDGVKIINCTPGSALTFLPYMDLSEAA